MRVAQLARKAGVSADTIRHYTREGLLHPHRSARSGYRDFDRRDLSRVLFIRSARQLGFSIDEIKEIFSCAEHGRSPCPQVRLYANRHLDEVRARLRELRDMEHRLCDALAMWEAMPNGVPHGDCVCVLIESWSRASADSSA